MDGKSIAQYISQPDAIQSEQLASINQLIEQFPYTSSLYILQLKALANSNDINFESKLKVAAAHVNDRAYLYELLNATSSSEHTVEESDDTIQTVEKVEESNISAPNEHLKGTTESLTALSEIDTSKELKAEEIEEPSKEISVESDSENNEIDKVEDSPDIADPLSAQIMSEAVSMAFEHSTEELISQDESIEIEQEEEIPTAASSIDESHEPETIDLADEAQASSEMTFIEWLKVKKGSTGETQSTSKAVDNALEKQSDQPQPTQSTAAISKKMSKKEINSLLDRFIAEQPMLKKPSKDFFKPSNLAKESIEESNENMTETLAQIHVMQGNYQKAINAYKQLSLLYPEKKAFFASRIKELEQKLS